MFRYFAVLITVFLIFIAVTWLLHWLFGERRIVKYIPALIAVVFGMYNIYVINTGHGEGFRDLAAVVYAVISSTAFVSVMVSGAFIDFVLPRIRG